MAAEVQVHPGVGQLLQLPRLVVQDEDGLALVHVPGDIFRGLPLLDAPAGALVVGAAVEIKAVVDEHALVLQEVDIGVSQKDIHARVAGLGFILVEGEPGEDLLLDVVVAVAGVDTVGALNGA